MIGGIDFSFFSSNCPRRYVCSSSEGTNFYACEYPERSKYTVCAEDICPLNPEVPEVQE